LTHPYTGTSFGPAGPRSFGEVQSAVVDQSTGDVYVYDAGTKSIYKFSAGGAPLEFSALKSDAIKTDGGTAKDEEQLAIDSSAGPAKGDIYLAEGSPGSVAIYDSETGASLGHLDKEVETEVTGAHWGEPCGVAVDPSGHVYVGLANGFVNRYAPTASLVKNTDYTSALSGVDTSFGGGEICNIAVDSEESVYADLFKEGPVRKYLALEFQVPPLEVGATGTEFARPGTMLAVEPTSNDVLIDQRNQIAEYSPAGVLLGVSGAAGPGALGESFGVAPSTSGDLYASGEAGKSVEIFGPAVVVPDVSLEAVSNLKPTSVTLSGSVNPDNEGNVAVCRFEYAPAEGSFSATPCAPATPYSGNTPVAVSANLAGLAPNTTYRYRLAATNTNGTNTTTASEFTTPGPPRITSTSSEAITQTTAKLLAKINPDGLATHYRFEYGETTAYGTSTPEAELPASFSEEEVNAALTGLKLGTTYHFRIVATNAAGSPVAGADEEFTTVPPALIDSESVTEVTATGATLQTRINPLGVDTHYYFRYGSESELAGTCAEYPASCVPAPPGGDVGAGTGDEAESVALAHLAPSTTYHYRAVASNVLGSNEGPGHTFTTQPVGAGVTLPDGRQYELVSPANKHGAEVLPALSSISNSDLIQASEDGGALTYMTDEPPIPDAPANLDGTQILSRRGSQSWASQDIATPLSSPGEVVSTGTDFQAFSSDLSSSVVQPLGPPALPLAPAELITHGLYKRNDAAETYQPLFTNVPPEVDLEHTPYHTQLEATTPDLRHIVFSSELPLTKGSLNTPLNANLYEWAEGGFQLVSVLPDREAATGAGLGNAGAREGDAMHAVSADGSHVIWTGDGEEGTHLYDRNTVTGETIVLDANQGGKEGGGGEYLTASTDGTRVFFTSRRHSTADAAGNLNLYEYDFAKPPGDRLTDLTVDGSEPEGADVLGVLGDSEDASYVYFVANGALAAGATEGTCEPNHPNPQQKCNLYVWHADGTEKGHITYVSSLSVEDEREWTRGGVPLSKLTARVSPNGQFVTFMSTRSLTGYDNVDAESPPGEPHHDAEVFLYDATRSLLRCVSCNPTGARPHGQFDNAGKLTMDKALAWDGRWVAAMIPGWTPNGVSAPWVQSRYLSSEGRLFFDSTEALVPGDNNGHEDVYEYEPEGVGSCHTATGCIALISTGAAETDSVFVEASASGNDVFFTATDRIAAEDVDEARDMYDAHVCTGTAPCFTTVAAPPQCSSGDACKAPPTPQPSTFGPPPSATFVGAGNVPPQTPGNAPVKPLTRAQKLANALRACRKKPKRMRPHCERVAKAQYGAAHKAAKRTRKAK